MNDRDLPFDSADAASFSGHALRPEPLRVIYAVMMPVGTAGLPQPSSIRPLK